MAAFILLRTSVLTLIVGMILGIVMGIRQDFALAPVHAHLNLVGFVMTFAAGLYYRLVPAAGESWLASLQATLQVLGSVTFPFGIAAVLIWGPARFEMMAVGGALIVLAAAVLFAWIVFRTTVPVPASGQRQAGFSPPI